jgi:hypothetical protein
VQEPEAPTDVERGWVRESVAVTVRELRLFALTAGAIAARPRTFAAQWVSGQRQALNPLGFMATAAAVVTVAATLVSRLAPLGGGSSSLAGEALDSLGPYLHYLALGLICHGILRLAGSRRSIAGSVAVALFVGGGPGTLATLLDLTVFLVVSRTFGKINFQAGELWSPAVLAIFVLLWATRIAVGACFVRAFAGLHQMRTWWPLLALVLALVITGLVFGLLDPPGRYGMHLVLGHLRGGKRSWWPAWAPM